VTSDESKTNTRPSCLFSELHTKLTCGNDNSNRPSIKLWTDKGIAGRLKSHRNNKDIPVGKMR